MFTDLNNLNCKLNIYNNNKKYKWKMFLTIFTYSTVLSCILLLLLLIYERNKPLKDPFPQLLKMSILSSVTWLAAKKQYPPCRFCDWFSSMSF